MDDGESAAAGGSNVMTKQCAYCASSKVAMSVIDGVNVCFFCQQTKKPEGIVDRLRTAVSSFDGWPGDAAALRIGNDWIASDSGTKRSLSVEDLRCLLKLLERSSAEPTTEEPEVVREGDCPNCHRHWTVKAPQGAVVSVLAVHCQCGYVTQ